MMSCRMLRFQGLFAGFFWVSMIFYSFCGFHNFLAGFFGFNDFLQDFQISNIFYRIFGSSEQGQFWALFPNCGMQS